MATLTQFTCFKTDIGLKKHDLNGDTIKAALTNTAPNAAHTTFDPVTANAPSRYQRSAG